MSEGRGRKSWWYTAAARQPVRSKGTEPGPGRAAAAGMFSSLMRINCPTWPVGAGHGLVPHHPTRYTFSTSMLALLRSTRGAKEVSRHVRALSTIAPSASSTDAGAGQPDDTAETRKLRKRLAGSNAECMFVYPWNGIRSSAEGLAIARAVQEKYGPAKEVIFPRVRYMCLALKPAMLSLTGYLFTGHR